MRSPVLLAIIIRVRDPRICTPSSAGSRSYIHCYVIMGPAD